MLPVSLDCPFFIAPLVFSNIYLSPIAIQKVVAMPYVVEVPSFIMFCFHMQNMFLNYFDLNTTYILTSIHKVVWESNYWFYSVSQLYITKMLQNVANLKKRKKDKILTMMKLKSSNGSIPSYPNKVTIATIFDFW